MAFVQSYICNSALFPKMRTYQWPRGPLCVFKHAETRFQPFILHFPPSETTILSSLNPSTHSPLSLIFIIIIIHHHHHQMASKEKVLQGNHPQGLVAHLPAAKPHMKLRGLKPNLMRKGDKCLVRGR
ncbi:hypothetical protein PIB30_066823 [Stylosanthes scabra]|uniref:Uncharacterized protein n=1 Tax=Stylosanthes scabra TaxID=79078 RepID=A0ABU6UR34_9FABA|nr:hypothetical protein [Stylosanthes scabra]